MLADAEWIEGDTHWRKNLPTARTTFAGDGFALVGDAAAFLDPLYSPGMDWISFTVTATAALIVAERRGEPLAPLLAKHNASFLRSYRRWFEAIYKDKYEYLGDFELMRTGLPARPRAVLSRHRLAAVQVWRVRAVHPTVCPEGLSPGVCAHASLQSSDRGDGA